MKRIALLALAAAGAVSAYAQPYGAPAPYPVAAPQHLQEPSFMDRARVQSVQPEYQVVQTPRQECTSQLVQDAPQVVQGGGNSIAGTVIGGVAGGVLGHQVGRGSGRDVATGVGAVVGAIAGNSIASNNAPQQVVQAPPREVRNCRTVMDQQQQITGYRVTYEYRGNQYQTITREQPREFLPVRVTVTPVDDPRAYHR